MRSEKLLELVDRQVGLAKDGSEGAASQFSMVWHDHRSTGIVAQLDMTSLLADLDEAGFAKRPDRLSARNDR